MNWARQIVSRMARQRVLVIGDVMLDRYIYGSVNRISPEAPVPVIDVKEERNMPGGAANVAKNIKALGGNAFLCGLMGNDYPGAELLETLTRDGIDTKGIIRLAGACTTVKTRILAERQQVVRVDWDKPPILNAAIKARMRERIMKIAGKVSGIIIEDYHKGVVNQAVVDAVMEAARRTGAPVGLDPKRNVDLRIRGLTVATPNRKEAFFLARMDETTPAANPLRDKPLLRAAHALIDLWAPRFLIITLGAHGMLVISREDRKPIHVPTRAREVFDVSGAGDTVIAATVLALSAGAKAFQAAELANCAAGVVVGKVGTASCSAAELLDFLDLLTRNGNFRKNMPETLRNKQISRSGQKRSRSN